MFAGRRWYSAALILALLAIAAQLRSNVHLNRRVFAIARAAAVAKPARAQLLQVGAWHGHRAVSWGILSITLGLATVCCWVLTYRDRTSVPHEVLWVLAGLYVLIALLVV